MAESSVVNLLDMRDEEDKNTGNTGGRWANRNPKAKAKAGGRNRRRHKDEGGGGGGRQSGFGGGGRQRMNSQTSGLSQTSDYSDDGEDQPQEKQASAPQTPKAQEPAEKESLFAKLQNEDQPGVDAKGSSRKDESKELLQNDPEAQKVAATTSGVGNRISSDGGGEIFAEARQIAGLRQLLKDEDPGNTGPEFKQNVWEYYKVKASWSDGLCVALNHANMIPCLVIPCLWPVRLFQTIRRAAPVKIKMCKCCQCNCGSCSGALLVFIIFSLPVAAFLSFLPQIQVMIRDLGATLPDVGFPWETTISISLSVITVFLMIFWWARVLLGVGMKYNILEAMDKPDRFVCKTMCCICAMNTRVGAHVDRAQGYLKILKADRTTIELSDTLRGVYPGAAPQQNVMV